MSTAGFRRKQLRRWLAVGLPIAVSIALAGWAAHAFSTAVHCYVAAYSHPVVILLAAVFVVVGVVTVVIRRSRPFGIGALVGGVMMLPLYLVAINVLAATGGIRWQNQQEVRIGPDVRASLVVYLKAGTSNAQINSVWNSVLSDPDPRGRGHMHLPGIGGIARVTPADGHEAIAVTLRPTATKEEIAAIRKRLDQCDYVYIILEDVVPADVEHLE